MTDEEKRKGEVLAEVFERFRVVEASTNPNANTTLNKEEVGAVADCIRNMRDVTKWL